MFNYNLLKKLLFTLDPEIAHKVAEKTLPLLAYCPFIVNYFGSRYIIKEEALEQKIFGKTFSNPVGLAAGFDKNAKMLSFLPYCGFSFLELGTITPKPQKGNPRPRIFRFVEEQSIQNSMGFNNDGLDAIKKRLEDAKTFCLPLGINIGKNKDTTGDDVFKDYEILSEQLQYLGDFFIVNLSSPNTPELRDFLNEGFVSELFSRLREKTNKPIFLKLSPDQDIDEAKKVVNSAVAAGVSAIIANNTSVDKTLLKNPKDSGGISGLAIKQKSINFFNEIAKDFFDKTVLISVGGIFDGDDAYERIKNGANLVEVYSSFIYNGPSLVKNINTQILARLKQDGFNNISQAVGANYK